MTPLRTGYRKNFVRYPAHCARGTVDAGLGSASRALFASGAGPASFAPGVSVAAEFTARELQSGNATLGLTGSNGTDLGDVRLQIETDDGIVPLAFVCAADGTLSAMHDTVRGARDGSPGVYRDGVPAFGLSTERTRVRKHG